MATLVTSLTTFSTAARASSIGAAGIESWGTPGNAQADDATRATYSSNAVRGTWTTYTHYLTGSDLADKVPAGATINAITVGIQRRESASDVATWTDSAVYIIKGGTIQTTQNKADATAYTTTDVSVNYGGDLWGVTWTAAQVNAADFGFAISCGITGDDGEASSVPEVDIIGNILIDYTAAVAGSASDLLLKGVSG